MYASTIDPNDPCYTIHDFTHLIGLTRQRLMQLWDKGNGPPVRRHGRSVCIPLESASIWLLRRATSPSLSETDRQRYMAMLDRLVQVRNSLMNWQDTAKWIADVSTRHPPQKKARGEGGSKASKATLPRLPIPGSFWR
jgi:hypothetical protein